MKNKNIHLIPTDKPSRLYKSIFDKKLSFNPDNSNDFTINQNIYITSDEEIKDGDWVYCRIENRVLVSNVSYSKLDNRFKIILTTDELYIHNDLIPKEYNPFPQYIQKIDDEFLEWYVKNPSCEEVEVVIMNEGYDKSEDVPYQECYKIIIPKEEPKQDTVGKEFYESADKVITVKRQEEPKQENCCTPIGQIKRYLNCVGCDQKPKQEYNNLNYGGGFTEEDIKRVSEKELKQETLEEAAERLVPEAGCELNNSEASYWQQGWISGHIDGAKWQAEAMYEIMNAYVDDVMGGCNLRAEEWFEQNKKH